MRDHFSRTRNIPHHATKLNKTDSYNIPKKITTKILNADVEMSAETVRQWNNPVLVGRVVVWDSATVIEVVRSSITNSAFFSICEFGNALINNV